MKPLSRVKSGRSCMTWGEMCTSFRVKKGDGVDSIQGQGMRRYGVLDCGRVRLTNSHDAASYIRQSVRAQDLSRKLKPEADKGRRVMKRSLKHGCDLSPDTPQPSREPRNLISTFGSNRPTGQPRCQRFRSSAVTYSSMILINQSRYITRFATPLLILPCSEP